MFEDWRAIVPLDWTDRLERTLRLQVGNIRFMRCPHVAYVGSEDRVLGKDGAIAQRESNDIGGLLTVVTVPGDHGSSLKAAILEFLRLITSSPR